MTDIASLQPLIPVEGSPDRLKTALAAAAGTCVENYDFIAFGTASALYFGAAFFPQQDAAVGTLLSFATLAVGFLMRPLGGAIGGFIADRMGRKPVLVAAMLVMGIATFLIGLLPTYATIGALAAVLLVVVRIVQGLAFGAEWGSAITMTYEHAPLRRRGQYAAIPQSGNYVGIALASLMFLVSSHLSGDWAWRVPFLGSAILIIVGVMVRLRLNESPEFTAAQRAGGTVRNPFLTALRQDWRGILRVIGLRIVESFAYYLTATYLLHFVTTAHPGVKDTALTSITVAAVLAIPIALLSGRLTDRIGRRPVYIASCVLAVVFGFPMYLLTNNGTAALVVVTFIIGISVIHGSLTGTQGSLLTEQFGTATRASGASIGYQVAASLAGLAPLLAALLTTAFGWPGAALLYVLAGVVGLVSVLTARETWGPQRRAQVEQLATRT
ncbi:MAG: MFS transporter [Propionibacteriaceae bacterium]